MGQIGSTGRNTHKLTKLYDSITPNWRARQRVLRALSNAIRRTKTTWLEVNVEVCTEWRDDRAAFLRYVITLPNWDNPDYYMILIDHTQDYKPGNIMFVTSTIRSSEDEDLP